MAKERPRKKKAGAQRMIISFYPKRMKSKTWGSGREREKEKEKERDRETEKEKDSREKKGFFFLGSLN